MDYDPTKQLGDDIDWGDSHACCYEDGGFGDNFDNDNKRLEAGG